MSVFEPTLENSRELRNALGRFGTGVTIVTAQCFDHCDWSPGPNDIPLIEGTAARFEGEKLSSHDGGDHAIVVGRVERAAHTNGEPLMLVGGKFGRFVSAT